MFYKYEIFIYFFFGMIAGVCLLALTAYLASPIKSAAPYACYYEVKKDNDVFKKGDLVKLVQLEDDNVNLYHSNNNPDIIGYMHKDSVKFNSFIK